MLWGEMMLMPDLRVLQLTNPDDSLDSPKIKSTPLCRGPGGSTITEVINLWRGSWGISKGVNDVDWGVASGTVR